MHHMYTYTRHRVHARVIAHMHTHMCISCTCRRRIVHIMHASYVYMHASSRVCTRHRIYTHARVYITYASSSHSTHHACIICIHIRVIAHMHAPMHISRVRRRTSCTHHACPPKAHSISVTCTQHMCNMRAPYTQHARKTDVTCTYHACVVAHHARTMHAHRMHTASVTHAHNMYVTCAHHIHDMHVRCTVRARALPYTCTFAWFSCTPRHRYVPRGKH
jgi:hypothetical protein